MCQLAKLKVQDMTDICSFLDRFCLCDKRLQTRCVLRIILAEWQAEVVKGSGPPPWGGIYIYPEAKYPQNIPPDRCSLESLRLE